MRLSTPKCTASEACKARMTSQYCCCCCYGVLLWCVVCVVCCCCRVVVVVVCCCVLLCVVACCCVLLCCCVLFVLFVSFVSCRVVVVVLTMELHTCLRRYACTELKRTSASALVPSAGLTSRKTPYVCSLRNQVPGPSAKSPNPKSRKKIARYAHLTLHSFGGRGAQSFPSPRGWMPRIRSEMRNNTWTCLSW